MTIQYLTKNHQNQQIYQNHFVNVKVYSINWKFFWDFLLFHSVEFLGLIADIVNGYMLVQNIQYIQFQTETAQYLDNKCVEK